MEFELTNEQRQAAKIIEDNQISILTGAPGVGKTYLSKFTIDKAEAKGFKISLCAPSGKAARRLSQSTGRQATTIHSLLEAKMINGRFSFGRDGFNKLDATMLVIDESSMIDSSLMADLLKAVDPHTKLLFIGDYNQLPPVGMGCVFKDMIESRTIPVAELTEIQRASGEIVYACHHIKDGDLYTPSDKLDIDTGRNLIHIECSSPQNILKLVKRIVCEKMPERDYNPIWDVQVLSPTNKRTVLSCLSINQMLQSSLNGNRPNENSGFAVGDKVINTKNKTCNNGTYVANGDLGTILDISGSDMTVKFYDPNRTVGMKNMKNDLLLAYCCTAHRYQGSEIPVVVIPVHSSFNFFVNRPWIYTAISRAQEICITVGEFSAIKSAIQKEGVDRRLTRLQERLAA